MLVDYPLRSKAISAPLAPAIRDFERSLGFAELDTLVERFSLSLRQRGVSEGECVAVASRNSIEYVALLLAVMRIRAVAVPLNIRLSAAEISRQLLAVGPSLLVTDFISREVAGGITCELCDFSQLESAVAEPSDSDIPRLDLEQVFSVCFTSGSDGHPKGVVSTLGNHYYNALGSNENIELAPSDTWHLSLPLFHVGGMGIMFRCLLAGAQVFVTDQFEPEALNQLIDSSQVSHLSLVPTMLMQLLEIRDQRRFPVSLKAVLVSGAPVPESLWEQIRSMEIPVAMSYGLTETASQITATRPGSTITPNIGAGRALHYRELKIVAATSNGTGEICVRGEVLFKGYVESTTSTFDSDGWFHTGDIGKLDEEQNLTVLGRKDEMFISGGENIFPQEIVAVAERIDGVVSAAVIPITDRKWGSRPIMFVELAADSSHSEATLLDEMAQSLARYKLPDRIILLEKMPRTAIGKIDRQTLIQMTEQL